MWWHEKHDVRKTRANGAKISTEKKKPAQYKYIDDQRNLTKSH